MQYKGGSHFCIGQSVALFRFVFLLCKEEQHPKRPNNDAEPKHPHLLKITKKTSEEEKRGGRERVDLSTR